MAKYVRYALAFICFVASVGCLALWWRSMDYSDVLYSPSVVPGELMYLNALRGQGHLVTEVYDRPVGWRYSSHPRVAVEDAFGDTSKGTGSKFGMQRRDIVWSVSFPLWYPALVSTLAGVAFLRLGRRFTLRSALIATTVVAGLLGMAVGL